MAERFGRAATRFAALLSAIAGVAVVTQTALSVEEFAAHGQGLGEALWRVAGYFTMLTNLAVALGMGAIALGLWRGRDGASAVALTGLMLAVALVGVIYHTLLSALWAPMGLRWWMDQGLHTATPVLTALFWLLYVPKAALVYRHALWWMAWPAAYAAYAFARGAWDGWFPYPFINAARLGWPVALRNAALLALAFLAVGLLLVWLCRSFARARATGVTAGASSG